MIKLVFMLLTEFFRKPSESQSFPFPPPSLRWRLEMRLNHLNSHLKRYWPRAYNFAIQALRLFVCNPFGHAWTDWEEIKYGNFGRSRGCKLCAMNEVRKAGRSTYSETHRPGGWVKISGPT